MNNSFKLIDFIRLLKFIEKLYSNNLGNNLELVNFIIKFINFLEPYKNLSPEEFFRVINHKKKKRKIAKKHENIHSSIDIQNLSFSDLRQIIQNPQITKEELLELGEKKLGISKGANRRLNKKQIRELIENAIKNVEALDIIKEKASK